MREITYLEVDTLSKIAKCWLKDGNKIRYLEEGEEIVLLPTVDEEQKVYLDILNIPNRLADDGKNYEFWDPSCYKEMDLTLPIYRKVGNKYCYINKYTSKIITEDTTNAAFDLWEQSLEEQIRELKKEKNEFVKQEISKLKEEQLARDLVPKLKKVLGDRSACGIINIFNYDLSKCYRELDLLLEKSHIRVFPVHTILPECHRKWIEEKNPHSYDERDEELKYTKRENSIAIFDMTKINGKSIIELQVPTGHEGVFIGKKAWQLEYWSKKLGIRRINVKGV